MFKNYFKLAIKVLGRHKFFTFISLFGISFTLMILMLVTAFLDTELGSHEPMTKRDKMVFMNLVTMKKTVTDTIPVVDSTVQSGSMAYDTTYKYEPRTISTYRSNGGLPFFQDYLENIEGTETQTFFSSGWDFDVFVNKNKLTLNGIYTDVNFFKIYDFDFVEGRAFNEKAIENQALSAVISKEAAVEYFGKKEKYLGGKITLEGKNYTIVGVVKTTRGPQGFNPDVILPYTNLSTNYLQNQDGFAGRFKVVFLAKTEKDKAIIQSELTKIGKQITMPEPENYDILELEGTTFREQYASRLVYANTATESLNRLFWITISLLLLFVLLPTLNLINLNVSRIMERSSEIGVRKAFGASSGNILIQFVFENVILTFIGGIIGFLLAFLLINIINNSQILDNTVLQFNASVFIYSLVICLFFGILSGIIPAYRMSKMQISKALRQ